MNRTLAERNMILATNIMNHWGTPNWILAESAEETATRTDIDEGTRDFLDFTDAISGDDLARLRMDSYQIVKPIGEQSGLWSDVRHAGTAAA